MTKTEAIATLQTQQAGIPFEALDFLMGLPYDKELEENIITQLDQTYDNRVLMQEESLSNIPLWYAILAEVHGSDKIIQSVIKLFTTPDAPDWDLLDEQGLYLVGLLSEKYPESIKLFLEAIEKQVSLKSNAPYLFLYDCVYFAKDAIHGEQIARLLNHPDTGWKSLLAVHVAEAHLDSCRQEIEHQYASLQSSTQKGTKENLMREELKYALELFVNKKQQPGCYYQQRGHWKAHYQAAEQMFTEENPMLANAFNNVGRNDLCPCGSGKKYKNCCLKS